MWPSVLAVSLALATPVSGAALPGAGSPVGCESGHAMRWLGPERSACLSRNESTANGKAASGQVALPAAVGTREAIVVTARPITGRHALLVMGNAPQNARITLTLLATIAPDLPTVLLQRQAAQADVDGRFVAVVSLAPDFFRGSFLTLIATSDGAESASTHLVLDGAL